MRCARHPGGLPLRGKYGRWRGLIRCQAAAQGLLRGFGTGTVGCAGLLAAKFAGCDLSSRSTCSTRAWRSPAVWGRRTPSTPPDPQLVERSDASRAGVGPSGASWKRRASPAALRRAAVEVLTPRGTACLVGTREQGSRCPGDADPATRPAAYAGASRESDVQPFYRLIELYRDGHRCRLSGSCGTIRTPRSTTPSRTC